MTKTVILVLFSCVGESERAVFRLFSTKSVRAKKLIAITSFWFSMRAIQRANLDFLCSLKFLLAYTLVRVIIGCSFFFLIVNLHSHRLAQVRFENINFELIIIS